MEVNTNYIFYKMFKFPLGLLTNARVEFVLSCSVTEDLLKSPAVILHFVVTYTPVFLCKEKKIENFHFILWLISSQFTAIR